MCNVTRDPVLCNSAECSVKKNKPRVVM